MVFVVGTALETELRLESTIVVVTTTELAADVESATVLVLSGELVEADVDDASELMGVLRLVEEDGVGGVKLMAGVLLVLVLEATVEVSGTTTELVRGIGVTALKVMVVVAVR